MPSTTRGWVAPDPRTQPPRGQVDRVGREQVLHDPLPAKPLLQDTTMFLARKSGRGRRTPAMTRAPGVVAK